MPSVAVRIVSGALFGASALMAMTPPDVEMIEQYRADGSLQQRVAFAKSLGNHQVNPDLMAQAQYKLKKLAMAKGLIPQATLIEPPPRWKDMPTTGNVKVLTILIDFNDYPHNELMNSNAQVTGRIFGNGDSQVAAPYESYHNFYQRSSYGKLNLNGNVLGWYRPAYNRADMPMTTAAREALIKEALNAFDAAGHDFSQYDNNKDGKVDFFAVIWTGPDNGWSNFWWGYQTAFNDSNFKLDGTSLGKYSWQWESRYRKPDNTIGYDGPFSPKTLIHEQGHGLGLPDYYDYDANVGPKGGIGGLDMMDSSGDHNCFSKWLMDWITPDIVNTDLGGATKQLRDQATNADALIVMPGASLDKPFSEFFMVQNRQLTGNDLNRPIAPNGSGLLVWHVDAKLDANNFDYLYDNSFTDHKLLRLMEADGLEQIETGARADAADFYVSGKEIGTETKPDTSRYDGTWANFGLRNIGASSPAMSLDVYTVPADATAPVGKPAKPSGTAEVDAITFTWDAGTAQDPDGKIVGYYLQVGSTPGGSDVFSGRVGNVLAKKVTDLGIWDGIPLYAQVKAVNTAGLYTEWSESSAGVTIALPVMGDCADLDNCNLVFKKVGTWEKDSEYYQQGTTSVHGLCADNERIVMQTRVAGPGTLSYYWKASTEKDFDYLSLSVDGVVKQRISGEVDWSQVTYEVPAGSHVIGWSWSKDANSSGALDKVWVDGVSYEKVEPLAITQQPVSQTVNVDTQVTFQVAVTGGKAPYAYQWYKGGVAINGATSAAYTFKATTADDGKAFKVVVTDSSATPNTLTSQEAILVVNGGMHEYQESEPNNTRIQANPVPKPGVMSGRVADRRDIDVFKVVLKKGQRLEALLTSGLGLRHLPMGLRMDCVDDRGRIVALGLGLQSKDLSVKARRDNEAFYVRVYYGWRYEVGDYQLELVF